MKQPTPPTRLAQALLGARREKSEALKAWDAAKLTGIDLDTRRDRWLEAQQKVEDLLLKGADDAQRHLDEGF